MRNKKQIRIWLIENECTQAQISTKTETSTTTVSLTISGHRSNQAVLDWLRDHGCPEEFLLTEQNAEKNTGPFPAK